MLGSSRKIISIPSFGGKGCGLRLAQPAFKVTVFGVAAVPAIKPSCRALRHNFSASAEGVVAEVATACVGVWVVDVTFGGVALGFGVATFATVPPLFPAGMSTKAAVSAAFARKLAAAFSASAALFNDSMRLNQYSRTIS